MGKWVIGYHLGAYVSMTEIALDVPGPIRKIISGFYLEATGGLAVTLAPKVTAAIDDDVQISDPTTPAGKRAIKIFHAANINQPIVFLFVETEHEVPGPKQAITP